MMMHVRRISAVFTMATGAGLAVGLFSTSRAAPAEDKPSQPVRMSLDQARRAVSMLNDLYVNSVILTHSTYVKDRSAVAAAVVTRRVFRGMEERGWPSTRWLSTTGRPFNTDANPKDAFERDAIAALKRGQSRFERVEQDNLRVATLVPITDQSCLVCHTKDKVGDPVGGLSYTVLLRR
jgi:hypothetical protein